VLQKILVPLDGSELAEAVLPYLQEVFRRPDPVEVVLLQVIRLPQGRTAATFLPVGSDFPAEKQPATDLAVDAAKYPIYREQEIASARAEAEAYLQPLARQMREAGFDARTAVAFGRPAAEIVRFAEEEGMDMIVLCTHGRSGISRWMVGSVADKVLRGTNVPITLIRPPSIRGIPFPPQTEFEI
jgi:nucleotide-binding universal stress UspA family protein